LSSADLAVNDLTSSVTDQGVDFSCNVALKASDSLELGMTIGDTPGDIGFGLGVGPKAANRDDMQCAVRSSVTAAVQAMPGYLARRSGNGADAT
jgi:hypothetical protein